MSGMSLSTSADQKAQCLVRGWSYGSGMGGEPGSKADAPHAPRTQVQAPEPHHVLPWALTPNGLAWMGKLQWV